MNLNRVTTPHRVSLRVIFRLRQYFFLIVLLAATTLPAAELRVGNNYQLIFTDVDKRSLSIADGHITIISVVTRKDESKAQTLGNRVPSQVLGNPKYRLINL